MNPSFWLRSLVGLPRRILRVLRHLPDRLLHAYRRRQAIQRLRSEPAPRSALFVCLGNINRSAFAAAAFERALASRGRNGVRIRSAGFIGPGRPSPDEAKKSAAALGIDLTGHESRTIDPVEVRETDLVVVMDARQRRRLSRETGRSARDVVVMGDLDPVRIVRRVVQDPYGHPDEVFDRVFARIDRCVAELAEAVSTKGLES